MTRERLSVVLFATVCAVIPIQAQSASPSSRNAPRQQLKSALRVDELEPGSVSNGVYRNRALGFSCKIPAGWVLRTDEMNGREEDDGSAAEKDQPPGTQRNAEDKTAGRVLLAAFSRPPEASGEDVNGSIVIAAESVKTYPGLTEAGQYLRPVEEVAKAQGFAVTHEPYEVAVGTNALPREDFQKDVGSRVMRQSTLVMLSRGYAVSFTFIGGTEDEVDELIAGLSFGAAKPTK